jgi:hypothetical protein
MRIISLLVFIFCFQFLAFTQNNIDVLHYKFNIGLNDVNDTILWRSGDQSEIYSSLLGVVYFDLPKMKNMAEV